MKKRHDTKAKILEHREELEAVGRQFRDSKGKSIRWKSALKANRVLAEKLGINPESTTDMVRFGFHRKRIGLGGPTRGRPRAESNEGHSVNGHASRPRLDKAFKAESQEREQPRPVVNYCPHCGGSLKAVQAAIEMGI